MRDWKPIVARAAEIVRSYDTGVTLRQLFYRLVAEQAINNCRADYNQLSDRTAEARRAGTFPALFDRTRRIERDGFFDGPDDAREYLRRVYRRDRTEGQETAVYLGVEKAGLVAQLRAWFSHYGVRILSLNGFTSQTFADDIGADIAGDPRPAVLLYAGDFDRSGRDIIRDFLRRCPLFKEARHIALTAALVEQYRLPLNYKTDKRDGKRGTQVELDALPPDVLRDLYARELAGLVDMSRLNRVLARERRERGTL